MASKWEDVVSDKNNFPDDTVIKLADGSEFRLGDTRSGYMKDSDYRQKTANLARQREALESESVQRMKAIQDGEAQLMQIATELMKANPGMTRQEARQEVAESSDPEIHRLRAELGEVKKYLEPLAKAVVDMDARQKKEREAFVVNEHRKALADLKTSDPELDEHALVQYAKDNYIPNLKKAYRDMNFDKIVDSKVKTAREEAFNEGKIKAKEETLAAPFLPFRTVPDRSNETRPRDFKDAFNKALTDPEIMNPLLGRQV